VKKLQHPHRRHRLTPKQEETKILATMDNNVRDILVPIAILGSMGTAVYFFAKVMTDYILKKKMIEKGFVNDDTQAIFKSHAETNRFSSLKWGLIILFGGLGLVVMEFIPTGPESPLPYGLLAVSISAGFLIYYFMLKKETGK
jgi:hypothetical protein